MEMSQCVVAANRCAGVLAVHEESCADLRGCVLQVWQKKAATPKRGLQHPKQSY